MGRCKRDVGKKRLGLATGITRVTWGWGAGVDLTEAEAIKKRWKEYMDELCPKVLHDPGKHDGVFIHLGQDVLKCEV